LSASYQGDYSFKHPRDKARLDINQYTKIKMPLKAAKDSVINYKCFSNKQIEQKKIRLPYIFFHITSTGLIESKVSIL
jgi:hypothetical protein